MNTSASEEIVELDVRADLAAGLDPFSKIMSAARSLPPGGSLAVVAPFEPHPLYKVLERMGFTHHSEALADKCWRVVFLRHDDV